MLTHLAVRNFAIIDRLQVAWEQGFNVITGETGAGKSIIVDAVSALLGDRLGPEVVRTGADRATVEGIFVLPTDLPAGLAAVLDEYGLEAEDGALIVTRDIAASGGRGGARVNGRAVPLAVLQQLGEQLVDIHGQSQHMALLRPREQLELLDHYAGSLPSRAEVAQLVRDLRGVRGERRALLAEERQAAREQEMLRYEIAEIDAAQLREGEEEELQILRSRLQHAERLRQAATTAYQALSGLDREEGERPGAVDLVGEALAAVQDGARFDASLVPETENLNSALAQVEESARSLRSYLETIEVDPGDLERIEERFFALATLKRKYGDSVAEILRYLGEARARLERYETRDERLAELADREERLLQQAGAAATALSERRRQAADRLAAAVERELADLHLRGTRFSVAITQEPDPEGLPLPDGSQRLAFDQTGVDRIEFLISPNPGEEPRPMARVASGGELARIALALKTILARADTRATLIFDEVDTGVGGRVAPVVGEKLWTVAEQGHQVLCVTHMPQVAAYADHHWVVAKEADDGRTHTTIRVLEADARLDELAAMLAGSTSASTRESARELVQRARTAKKR